MAVRVAINGFGRIGRLVYRAGYKGLDLDIVAINDLTDAKTLAHLLKYDSVHRTMNADVKAKENAIVVDGKEVKVLAERDPEKLPWKDLNIDVVLESTGRFTDRAGGEKHLKAGAKKVIISAPAKGPDVTIVLGVNQDTYDKSKHNIISMGSCTTNCLAPVIKVLQSEFGIQYGFMTTVHSYTNDQVILDFPHRDLRRARAAAMSIIPTTTGAARAIGEVIPEVKGKLDGFALRVPTPTVSLCDLALILAKPTTREAVNDVFRKWAAGPMKGVMLCVEEELVSSDFIGCPYASCVDLPSTNVMNGTFLKVLSWYDNEWGFSSKMAETIALVMR